MIDKTTAKRLKEVGYPQPTTLEVGQFWYVNGSACLHCAQKEVFGKYKDRNGVQHKATSVVRLFNIEKIQDVRYNSCETARYPDYGGVGIYVPTIEELLKEIGKMCGNKEDAVRFLYNAKKSKYVLVCPHSIGEDKSLHMLVARTYHFLKIQLESK